ILICLAGGLLLVGCQGTQPPPPPPGPPKVTVAPAFIKEVTDYEEFNGKTEAIKTVEVRAQVSGYLQAVHFTEGAEVKEGDLLFEIDPRPFQAELDRSEANIQQFEARVTRLEADAKRGATLTGAAMSREEYDKIVGDLREARAALLSSKAARAMS